MGNPQNKNVPLNEMQVKSQQLPYCLVNVMKTLSTLPTMAIFSVLKVCIYIRLSLEYLTHTHTHTLVFDTDHTSLHVAQQTVLHTPHCT